MYRIKTLRSTAAFALAAMFAVTPLAMAGQGTQKAPADPPASQDPGDSDPQRRAMFLYIEGERYESQGDTVRATESYKKAIELAPDAEEPRVALARLYLNSRNIAEARTTIVEATRRNPKSIPARSILAQIYIMEATAVGGLDKEKAKAAIAEIEEIVKIDEKADLMLGSQPVKALALLGQLYDAVDNKEKALSTFERLSKVDSSSARSFLLVAEAYFDQNKYREAVKAAEQARKLADSDSERLSASVLLARSLSRAGRTSEALEVFKGTIETLDKAPNRGQATRNLKTALLLEYADALTLSGKYQEAAETAKKLLVEDSKNLRAVRIIADTYRRSGRRDLAVKTIEDAIANQDVSESLPLVFALAETYEEMEQFEKAVSTYEDALSALVNPDGTAAESDKQNVAVVLRRIAIVHRIARQPEKVKQTFDRMRKVLGEGNPLPDQLEIQNALEMGQYDEAVTLARKAGATAVKDADKRSFLYAEAQGLGRKGDLAGALKILDGMVAKGAEATDVYQQMAILQLDNGDVAGAERSIRKALEIEPNDIALLITLSSVMNQAKRYSESEASLRKVLTIDPDNATALNNLGYFLTERKERLDEALQLIQRAVNIDPTNGSFLDSLGWLYFQMGKLPEAQRYLEQAGLYEHQSSTIREHLGDLYKKLGDMDKARQQWEHALRLANEQDEIARLKGKIKGQ